jgi:hypothetical protein
VVYEAITKITGTVILEDLEDSSTNRRKPAIILAAFMNPNRKIRVNVSRMSGEIKRNIQRKNWMKREIRNIPFLPL